MFSYHRPKAELNKELRTLLGSDVDTDNLMKIPLSSLTLEAAKNLEKAVSSTKDSLATLEGTGPEALWKRELQELAKKISS